MSNYQVIHAEARTGPESVPPINAACRAKKAADTDLYSHCLLGENIGCAYLIRIRRLGNYCVHPLHKKIVARTSGEGFSQDGQETSS
jgi:hypothetical protein